MDTPTPNTPLLQRLLWPLLAGIALIGAVALFGLWWVSQPPREGDPAVVFARDMSAHHAQAVEMAVIVYDRTESPALRQFALDIILTQQGQIGIMQGWLDTWGLPYSGAEPPMQSHHDHAGLTNMGMASQDDVNALKTLPVEVMEIHFLRLMIRHHQGGVIMAEEALQTTARPEIVRLAQSIINAQSKEIEYMQAMLSERGEQP